MDAEERKKELMAQNDIKDGMMFKMDNDPRIIKGIGNFIRDYSLDEFPQFWNVLIGDMSLVGTRPPTVDEWEKYEMHHRSRLAFKPGLTGMWQVSGRSNITDFEEVVRLDAMIYSNMLWEAYELDLEKLLDYPVWYADYEELPQTPYRFSMWQYSSTGSVPGIEGNVDLNIQLLKK